MNVFFLNSKNKFSFELHSITLWKLPRSINDEATVVFRKELADVVELFDLAMDDTLIVLFSCDNRRSSIETRRTNSYDLVSTIQFKTDEAYSFDYQHGLIAVGKSCSYLK